MARVCPNCESPLPDRIRASFCPSCSLRGALDLPAFDELDPGTPEPLGDYELLELIGRGGMGAVYRARQRSLDRFVAIKLLLAGAYASEEARRRFQSEARAAAGLRHPNIVTIHEIGESGNQLYFTMELIQGPTLAEASRTRPMTPQRAATLLRPIAAAVHYAHERGVLHRDLKPTNVLLDADEVPHVSDFGLARSLDSTERLTLTGEVLGSPSYLSPEQARGDRAEEGVTSDVYSLGTILYELLCGRPPFLGDSPQSVLRQVAEGNPIAPRRLNPSVPRDLETICLKCLEREPRRRYPSASILADELGCFLSGEPIRARPVGPATRAIQWAKRQPALAGLVVALALLSITLIVAPSFAYVRISRAEADRLSQWHQMLVTKAHAIRRGGQAGRRTESLAALREAEQLKANPTVDPELRREAIASLALDDASISPAADLPSEPDETYLSVSADGTRVAQGSFRGPIRLLDRPRGNELLQVGLGFRPSLQHVLRFDPRGRYLAVRHGTEIAIWDLTNRTVATAASSWLHRFSFHPGGQSVAFLQTNGTVEARHLPSGQLAWRWPLEGRGLHSFTAGGLAFSPDGQSLAIGRADGHGLEVRQVSSGAVIWGGSFPDDIGPLTWSADGRWLAAGGHQGTILVWETGGALALGPGPSARASAGADSRSEPGIRLEGHTGPVRALAFSPDGHRLISSGHDEIVRLHDLRVMRSSLTFSGVAFQLGFFDHGQRAGPIWQGGRASWIVLTNSDVFTAWRAPSSASSASGAALDPNTGLLAVTQADSVRLFHFPALQPALRVTAPRPSSIYWLPTGELIAVGWTRVSRWMIGRTDAPTWAAIEKPGVWPRELGGDMASFSANVSHAALANYLRDEAWLGAVTNGMPAEPGRVFSHRRIASVALSPDARWLATASLDLDPIRIWDLATGKVAREWPAAGDYRIAFSPDGRWLAQQGLQCRLWEVGSWAAGPNLGFIPRNTAQGAAEFSPNRKFLAATGADHEIHLLSLPRGDAIGILESPTRLRVNRLSWSLDSSYLVATTLQGEVQIWSIRRLLEQLQALDL